MARGPLPAFFRHLRRLAARHETGPLSDRQLLRRFTDQHDEAAFATLMDRHGGTVLAVGRRVLHDRHAAEDIFQATFLVLARKAASIRKQESLASWLYGVAYRLAVRAKTQAAARRSHEQRGEVRPAVDPVTEVIWRELGTVLDEELARLPERCRAPLVLCYLEGKTQDEAARQLGWAKSTLQHRLDRGRELLRVRLERRGVLFSTGLLATALSQGAASAAVSATLFDSTVEAALAFGTGEALAGMLSTQAATLAKGALQAMLVTKLKIVSVAVLAVGMLGLGAGGLTYQVLAEKQAADGQAAEPKPPAKIAEKIKPVEQPKAGIDRYGDALPEGAAARLGTVRFRQDDSITSVAFSPDGKTLVVGGIIREFSEINGKLSEASAACVRFWDPVSGLEKLPPKSLGSQQRVRSLGFSPKGTTLAIGIGHMALPGAERVLRLDVESGKWRGWLQGHEGPVDFVAFAPDGKTLAVATDDKSVRLWSETGQGLAKLTGHTGEVLAAAFSPDGKTLATGSADRTVRLWNASNGRRLRQLNGHEGAVRAVAFSPNGSFLVSGSEDKTIRLWAVDTGKEIRRLGEHQGMIRSVALTPDGKYVAGGGWGSLIRLWELETGNEVLQFERSRRYVGQLAISPDGQRLVSAEWGQHALQVWDLATGKEISPSEGHSRWVAGLAYAPDGKTLFTSSFSEDGILRQWEAATGKEIRQIYGPGHALARSPDGRILAFSSPRVKKYPVHLWDTGTEKELRQLEGHQGEVYGLAFSPNGRTLATGSADKTVRLWEVATGKELRRLEGHLGWVLSVAFPPDGTSLASVGSRDVVRLWNLATGELLLRLPGPHGICSSLAFSADGKVLVAASDGYPEDPIWLWEMPSGKELRPFHFRPSLLGVRSIAFSPDGRALAAGGSDNKVRLWELATGEERCCFTGHQGIVEKVAFSPDGKSLASGSQDTTILIWDLQGQVSKTVTLTAGSWKGLWADLASPEAGKAYEAMRQLMACKQTVSLLQQQLQPAPPVDGQRVRRLLAELDSNDFKVRQQAVQELEKLAELAEPTLHKALEGKPNLEVQKRITQLLENLRARPPAQLRMLRAVEVLEHVGSQEARQVLETLSKGAPEARLTQEAKASLERLAKRQAAAP